MANGYVVHRPGPKGTVESEEKTLAELSDEQLQQMSVYGDTDPAVLAERIMRRSKGKTNAS